MQYMIYGLQCSAVWVFFCDLCCLVIYCTILQIIRLLLHLVCSTMHLWCCFLSAAYCLSFLVSCIMLLSFHIALVLCICYWFLVTHSCHLSLNCWLCCAQLLRCTPCAQASHRCLYVYIDLLQRWACTHICYSRAQLKNQSIKKILVLFFCHTFGHQSRDA